MPTYKTPDVYVQEISLLPPSVAEVATAIPAFVGYTEKAERNGASLLFQPVRVKSLLEYNQYFGGPLKMRDLEVEVDDDNMISKATVPGNYFYDSLQLFFSNGGGPCYIVSVGFYRTKEDKPTTVNKQELLKGLESLRKEDEPTMLVVPDAMLLDKDAEIADVQQKMLAQCEELGDRVAIFDVKYSPEKDVDKSVLAFRNGIGMKGLKYGAAYFPFLRTSLPCAIRYKDIAFKKKGADKDAKSELSTFDTSPAVQRTVDQIKKSIADLEMLKKDLESGGGNGKTYPKLFEDVPSRGKAELVHYVSVMRAIGVKFKGYAATLLSETLKEIVNGLSQPGGRLEDLVKRLAALDRGYPQVGGGAAEPPSGDTKTDAKEGGKEGPKKPNATRSAAPGGGLGFKAEDFEGYGLSNVTADEGVYGRPPPATEAEVAQNARSAFRALFSDFYSLLTTLKESAERTVESHEEILLANSPLLQRAIDALQREATTVPPSGAMAGIYAYVDNTRGVWKAPANVSLSTVVEPVVRLDSKDQENLNVDVEAGKSINAIRAFAGKGTLVWGARTLAGNDNEWRYVSVRRFYNMAEESIKKSTYWAVFEPNDANTWIKVKSMIENYLTQKWREGALAGAKPEDAFFVKLGLGVTMTPVDVLEGRMNVEIGMAVVRPAEFIVLKFSHKMQTS